MALGCVLGIATMTKGGVTGSVEFIGPFVGDATETFESFFLGDSGDLDIFGGAAVMSGGFVTSGSSFMGSTIVAHTGVLFAHWTAPVDFYFDSVVTQFGGYIATNGGADGGFVEFFGVNNQLFDTAPLDVVFQAGTAPYTWNGWISDVPITHVRVTGNGVLNAFLGFDDLQATFLVPAPGAIALLAIPLAWMPRRRGLNTRRSCQPR